jgi:hypothetical protein
MKARVHGFTKRAVSAVAYCPRCKAMETIEYDPETFQLVPTRKWFQTGRAIYHDCGATESVRLYRAT